jgi:hypothetical protein
MKLVRSRRFPNGRWLAAGATRCRVTTKHGATEVAEVRIVFGRGGFGAHEVLPRNNECGVGGYRNNEKSLGCPQNTRNDTEFMPQDSVFPSIPCVP